MPMLSFFRKYQKYFFFLITVVIVTSFVFFGTFQVIAPVFKHKEITLFKTCDGIKISQSYLDDMSRFLASEPLTKKGFHNFLNDHVIAKDFLDTHMGYLLTQENGGKIYEELAIRGDKEKLFRPYCHPARTDLCAHNVWLTFAPLLHSAFERHKHLSEFHSKEAFQSRVDLFLAERRFPSEILSYILRYEEKQSPDLRQDHRLQNDSLALFGYGDLNDWFGPTYVENAAKAIIRAAAFARTQGYRVSEEEIAADIHFKSERAFQYLKEQTKQWPNSHALYQDCLKMLQLDEPRVLRILEDILLFRHLFQDVTGLNLVDDFSMQRFYEKAHECVEIEVISLPGEYLFKKSEDLKKFEIYLNAVAPKREDPLSLPDIFDSIETIEERAQELLASVYVVELSHVTKSDCEARVTVKETWAWENDNESIWRTQFPEIASLEHLSGEMRAKIDAYARREIVKAHPEWITEALARKKSEEKRLVLPKMTLEGIKELSLLKPLLEKQEVLNDYSQDGEHYYNIKVKERLPKELLTYKEARDAAILDKMVKAQDDKNFDRLFEAIYAYAKAKGLVDKFSKEELSSLRFVRYLEEVRQNSEKEKALWPLPKKREEIFRYSKAIVPFEHAFSSLKEGASLTISETVGPFFYRFKDHRVENPLPLDKMLIEEKLISDEMRGTLLETILRNG